MIHLRGTRTSVSPDQIIPVTVRLTDGITRLHAARPHPAVATAILRQGNKVLLPPEVVAGYRRVVDQGKHLQCLLQVVPAVLPTLLHRAEAGEAVAAALHHPEVVQAAADN